MASTSPPHKAESVTMASHEQEMQQERQRYDQMHSTLSSEIEVIKESKRKLQETVDTLRDELKTTKQELSQDLKATKTKLKQSQKKIRDLEKIVKPKRARDEEEVANATTNNRKKKRSRIPHPDRNHETQWEEKFQRLKEFQQEHGHCNVSRHDHKDLYLWISGQRTQHRLLREGKNSSLRSDRIRKLNSINFPWTVAKTKGLKFEERIKQLQQFQETHGHVNVKQNCENDPPGLGNFVLEMRRHYKAASLTQDKIEALEELGFQWSLRNRQPKHQSPSDR